MENLPKNVAEEWKKWCNSKNYLFDHISPNSLFFDKINCELISYSVENDEYAPKKSVDWLTLKYSNSNYSRIHLTPNPTDLVQKKLGHFELFRESFEDSFWQDLKKEIV
ncbi:hypothetical protein [Flavobacterium sp. FlaQc-28]|uniref:hypothetical protein n=1 Tax=Flavobacterium sp. FlaQc-28 TaxID=3374178 RepID=UPI0037574BA1